MTADEIVASFAGEVHRLVERVGQGECEGVGDLVSLVLPVVRSLGRALVALLFDQLQRRQRRAPCASCGRLPQAHGERPRTIVTMLGEVRLGVRRYRCEHCGVEVGPGLADSDLRGCCSPEVWRLVLELAAKLPYRSVEWFCGQVGLPLSDDLVEALVAQLGGGLSAVQRAGAQALASGRGTVARARTAERLYVLVDGRMVRVDGHWRELKVGLFFETDVAEPDARGQWPAVRPLGSYACVGSADEFLEGLFAEALRWGLWRAKEVVLLADGAPWIWERLPQLVPVGVKTVQILDFYHAAEHVRGAVDAVLGPSGGRFLGRRLTEQLQAGEFEAVLRSLQQLRDQARGEARHTVHLTLGYLRRHRDRCQYFRRHWEGYYIGSGRVESVCKQLGLRFKGCGMNWSADGLAALLAVYNNVHSAEPLPWPAAA